MSVRGKYTALFHVLSPRRASKKTTHQMLFTLGWGLLLGFSNIRTVMPQIEGKRVIQKLNCLAMRFAELNEFVS